MLLVGLTAIVAVAGWTIYRIQDQGRRDEQRQADAIVVLGAAQYNGWPSPVLQARLEQAVDLYRAGVAPVVIVTGGKRAGDWITEAGAAMIWVERAGIPSSAILIENRGRTTLESLDAVAQILQDHGLTSAVFVSDRTHMLRVLRIATDLRIVAWGSPTTTGPADADPGPRLEAIVHELGALAVYFVGGGHVILDESTSNP